MIQCKNKLSNYPFLTGCSSTQFIIPILNYESGQYKNYNLDFSELKGLIDTDTNTYVTGATLSGDTLILERNDGGTMYVDLFKYNYDDEIGYLNSKVDFHTGNTNNPHQTSFYNLTQTAHTHTLSEIIDYVVPFDIYLSAGTYSNGFIYFSGHGIDFSVDVTPLIDDTNTYVTGGTMSGDTLILNRNDGIDISIDQSQFNYSNAINYLDGKIDSHTGDTSIHFILNDITLSNIGSSAHTHTLSEIVDYVPYEFTGNTSATCISDLYVHNLGGCSPINLLTDITPTPTIIPAYVTNELNFPDTYGTEKITPIVYNGILYGVVNESASNKGYLYSYDPSNDSYNMLYVMQSPGRKPMSAPVFYDGKLYGISNRGGSTGYGAIWAYNLSASTWSVIHNFLNNSQGVYPQHNIIIVNGVLYGITQRLNSVQSAGGLYRYTINTNTYQLIQGFSNGSTTGTYPTNSLIHYNGKIFGATVAGGINNKGVIYQFDITGGTFSLAKNDLSSSIESPFTLHSDNLLYGVSANGGINGYGTIFSFNPNTYTLNIVHTFNQDQYGYNPYGGLLSNNNKLYGTTQSGTIVPPLSNNYGVIFEFNPITTNYSVLYTFENTSLGNMPRSNLITLNNKLYGTTHVGGTLNSGVLFEYTSSDSQSRNIGSNNQPFKKIYTNDVVLNPQSLPTSSGDTMGDVGQMCWDDNNLYVKTNLGWGKQSINYNW